MSEMELSGQLVELIELRLEDRLDDAGAARLRQLVTGDEALRAFYCEYVALHAMLRLQHSAPCNVLEIFSASSREQSLEKLLDAIDVPAAHGGDVCPARPVNAVATHCGWRAGLARMRQSVVAVTLLLALGIYGTFGLVVWQMGRHQPGDLAGNVPTKIKSPAPPAVEQPQFAVVEALVDCQGHALVNRQGVEHPIPLAAGLSLAQSRVVVERGTVKLRYTKGATTAVTGPAELRVLDDGKIHVTSGKLLANVPPPAIGFTVETPQATIVDLGTQFGVHVVPDRPLQVHVFMGEVKVRQTGNVAAGQRLPWTHLHAGQSCAVTVGDEFEPASVRRGDRVSRDLFFTEQVAKLQTAAARQPAQVAQAPSPAVAPPDSANVIPLTQLKPVATEYGLYKVDEVLRPASSEGPNKLYLGVWDTGYARTLWPNNLKILAKPAPEVDAAAREKYRSIDPELFLVGGKSVAGVGLLCKTFAMYHWIDYDIPAGATRLVGNVCVTDDPGGYAWMYPDPKFQKFDVRVLVDGKPAYQRNDIERYGKTMGSGEVLGQLKIDLPPNAKRLRLLLQTSPDYDLNRNVEIVFTDTAFERPKED